MYIYIERERDVYTYYIYIYMQIERERERLCAHSVAEAWPCGHLSEGSDLLSS